MPTNLETRHNSSMKSDWAYTYPAEIMVCAPDGLILEMNQTAIQLYQQEGGAQMIGTNVFDHHSEPATSQVRAIVARQQATTYTTQKENRKTLVRIAPWYREEQYAGFVLITFELPEHLPNIIKD